VFTKELLDSLAKKHPEEMKSLLGRDGPRWFSPSMLMKRENKSLSKDFLAKVGEKAEKEELVEA
jgi:hypothetical protein